MERTKIQYILDKTKKGGKTAFFVLVERKIIQQQICELIYLLKRSH